MPTWIADDPSLLYLILGTGALVCLAAWWLTRKKRWGLAVAGCVLLAGLVWLLDFALVSDHEQIVASIDRMGAAVRRQDANALFDDISEQFQIKTMDRAAFRNMVEGVFRSREVREVVVWDVEPAEVQGGTATVGFNVKAKGDQLGDAAVGRCKATFVRDPDGRWRLKTFEIFKFGTTEHLAIPHLPN